MKAAFDERVIELQDEALDFITEEMNSPEHPTFDQAALKFMKEGLKFTPDRMERAEKLRQESLASYDEFMAALNEDQADGQAARIITSPIRSLFVGGEEADTTGRDELFNAYMTEIGLRGNPAAASDVVRFMALKQSGGLYLDADVLPSWNGALKDGFDRLCADIKAGPSWTEELNEKLWDEGGGMGQALTEAVLDKLGDAFPARQALRGEGRYESAMAAFPEDIQRRIRLLVDTHADDAANKGRSISEVWFEPLGPIRTAPDLMRLSCAGGKPAGAALVAQPGARCVDDALKTIRRNYRVLDHVGSQDGNEAPSAREASFRQAMRDTSRELDLAVDVSTLRYTDLAEYRTAFGGGTQRPQVGISGPSAHAEQLADVFHALPGGGFEKHFAFDSLNLFTEEDRTSACAEGAYAVRIRRQREDSISTWVENAHADRVRRTEAQRAEKADASIRSAVSSAVNWEWGRVESETRRKRTPNLLGAFGDAASPAAYTRAAQSFPRDAPDQLVSDVYSALMSTPQGKTARQSLIDTGNKYNGREHGEFHRMLGAMAAADAGATLSDLDRLLRARAKRTTAASAERDAAEAARRGSARQAESDAQDAQVRERANQATRRTSLAGSTLGNEYEWGDRTSRKQREERELRELRGSAPPVPTDEPGWSRRRELRGESDAPRPRPVPVVRAQVPEDHSTPAATAGQGLGNPRGSGEAQASRPSPARGARTHGRQPAT